MPTKLVLHIIWTKVTDANVRNTMSYFIKRKSKDSEWYFLATEKYFLNSGTIVYITKARSNIKTKTNADKGLHR